MKLPCETCPFPERKQPCEPTSENWAEWRATPQGLLTASHVGECLGHRNKIGDTTDPRTGLDNFQLMRTRLASLFTHPPRRGESVALDDGRVVTPILAAFIDGDRFGEVNAEYDYDIGNDLIAALGHAVDECGRKTDVKGRWGGDEFALAFVGFRRDRARQEMEKMRRKFRTGGSIEASPGGDTINWTATIVGAYIEDPRGIEDVDVAFRMAGDVLGTWKKGDRQQEPELMIEVPLLGSAV